MPRRAWLLPGRRQALLVSALILVAGASLLLLPDRSTSYRAVATATAVPGTPACVEGAPDWVGSRDLRRRVASRSRVPLREVADATEVLPVPAGGLLSVAFEADSGYAAQRGAFATASLSVARACAPEGARLLLEVARAEDRRDVAADALRAATAFAAPAPPPAPFVAERDEAAAAVETAVAAFTEVREVHGRITSVRSAEALGSERSALQDLAVPGGVVLCAVLALLVLRTGWRRAAGPVPA